MLMTMAPLLCESNVLYTIYLCISNCAAAAAAPIAIVVADGDAIENYEQKRNEITIKVK